MEKAYFVQLPGVNTTLNLAYVAAIEWDSQEPKGTAATVFLVNGHATYLTAQDTPILWKALQAYNQRSLRPYQPAIPNGSKPSISRNPGDEQF
jgi:hypothetical protein